MIDGVPWEQVTPDEVNQLHRAEIERAGAVWVPPKDGCVESSIGSAVNASLYLSENGDADLIIAGAYLLFYLAKNHCYTDGNKRAAWMALTHMLYVNGLKVACSQQDAADLVERVADGRTDQDGIRQWLAGDGRLVALADPQEPPPLAPETGSGRLPF